jgi:signal transduction histidine kinase
MSDLPTLQDAPIVGVARALADRKMFGLVWVDRDLVITGRFGALVDFVEVGEPVFENLPVLTGMEGELNQLTQSGRIIDLPAVSIVTAEGQTPRVDLQLAWLEEQGSLLCIVSRTSVGSEIELELSKEIRRRLMAEADTVAALRELELANRDLEAFAEIISHDLQAPMRSMRYELEALAGELHEAAGSDVRARVGKCSAQLGRMSDMLKALLEYSSRSDKEEMLAEVDTRHLIEEIVASLDVPEGFDVTIAGDWSTFQTLRSPLDCVLRNLIDNAVKHHHRAAGRIMISAADRGAMVEYIVADDGPGIDVRHRQSVFLPFRKLESTTDAPERGQSRSVGSGLGLAYVKRIVDGLGGQIDIHEPADSSSGTAFRIVWPKAPGRLGG